MTTHQIKRYLSAIPDSVPHRVAGMDWIKWPVCIGLGGRIDWITHHYYKISRGKKRVNPMGTFDHLIISMGIHLAHIHGRDNVCILSCDDRLIDILSKCKSHIPWNIVKKLGLNSAHELTGRRFGPKLFPKHLNLKGATKTEYERIFHTWPLPECKVGHVYRHKCE